MLSVATQNYNLAVCQKQFFCFAQIAAKEIATIKSFIENTILGRSKIESKSISSTNFPRKKSRVSQTSKKFIKTLQTLFSYAPLNHVKRRG